MTMPTFTMRQLLDAGVHFGHQTRRWNPKVAPYLFGERGGIHIIDLQQTVPMLHQALQAVRDCVASGGRVLFVGTKRQAADVVKQSAELCGQFYVNHRWLGGMMTNWKTISQSIKRLNELDEIMSEDTAGYTKKEVLKFTRERAKLQLSLGGIRNMGGAPNLVFVLDTNKEDLAIKEANRLNIPVIAIVDSNSNPDGVDYLVPGNDDATRAIELYCNLVSAAVLDGLQAELTKSGRDVGASKDVIVEMVDVAQDTVKPVASKAAPKATAKPEAKAAEPKTEKKAAPKVVKTEAKTEKKPVAKKEAAEKPAAKKATADKPAAKAKKPAAKAKA